jgi:hypothetical protein
MSEPTPPITSKAPTMKLAETREVTMSNGFGKNKIGSSVIPKAIAQEIR